MCDLIKIAKFVPVDSRQQAAGLRLALFFSLFASFLVFASEKKNSCQNSFFTSPNVIISNQSDVFVEKTDFSKTVYTDKRRIFDAQDNNVFVDSNVVISREYILIKEKQRNYSTQNSKKDKIQKEILLNLKKTKEFRYHVFNDTSSEKYFSLVKDLFVAVSTSYYHYDIKNPENTEWQFAHSYFYNNAQFYYSILDVIAYRRKISIRPPPVLIA